MKRSFFTPGVSSLWFMLQGYFSITRAIPAHKQLCPMNNKVDSTRLMKRWAWLQKNPSRKSEQVTSIFDTSNQWDCIKGCIIAAVARPKATCEGSKCCTVPCHAGSDLATQKQGISLGRSPRYQEIVSAADGGVYIWKRLLSRKQFLTSSMYWSGWYDWRVQSPCVLTAGDAAQHYKQHPHLTSPQPSSVWRNKLNLWRFNKYINASGRNCLLA